MRGYKLIAPIAIATLAYAPVATAGPLGNFGRGLVKTVENAIIAPMKGVVSLVEELDPVKGLRRGVLDTVEEAGYTLSCQDSGRRPDENGEINQYIEERPALEAVVDMGAAYGLGSAIAHGGSSSAVHVYQAGIWSAAGEGVIKAAKPHLERHGTRTYSRR